MGPPLSLQETPLHWNVSATVGFAALPKPGSLATKNTRGPNLGEVTNVTQPNGIFQDLHIYIYICFIYFSFTGIRIFTSNFPIFSWVFSPQGPNASGSFTSQWPILSSWTWCVTDSHHTSVQWFQYFTQRPGKPGLISLSFWMARDLRNLLRNVHKRKRIRRCIMYTYQWYIGYGWLWKYYILVIWDIFLIFIVMTINVIYKGTYPTMMWYSWSLPRGFGDATPFSAASNRLGALGRCLNTIQCESSCCSWYVPRRYERVGVGDGQSVQSCALKVWKNWDAFSISDLSLYWLHPLPYIAVIKLNGALRLLHLLHSIYVHFLNSWKPSHR